MTATTAEPMLTSYDEVPYPRQAFPQTHPDRLATIATLFGVKPPAIDKCRVLELACACGDNIIPMACTFPESQFVGIDLSSRELAEGQKLVDQLGLKNIELKHLDIMKVGEELGKFDYIIAHGIFSWGTEELQEKLLEICKKHLNPNGVAYVSYNTYPGWHYRGMIRDMMLYHTKDLKLPAERAQQARALLDFLATNVPTENSAYGIMLQSELQLLRQMTDSYFLHDHLEEMNKPVYFHQFIERANKHELQFLGEADFATMITSNFSKEVNETIARISGDIIRTEQYMDFVRNRTFRQTLLVHAETPVRRALGPLSVMPFHVGSRAKTSNNGVNDGAPVINTTDPMLKAAFDYLAEVWPATVKFGDLVKVARERSNTNGATDAELLAGSILSAYASGVCVLRTQPDTFITRVTERPAVKQLVREQAKIQERVNNQVHDAIQLDVVSRHFIQLLDGTRDRNQLLEEMVKLVKDDVIRVHQDGTLLQDGEQLRAALGQSVDFMLNAFAKSALLVA